MAPDATPERAPATTAALRELFLLEPGLVFLNHGSYGACPHQVFETFQRWQLQMEKVRMTQHGGHTFVRVSVQAYNTQAELDILVDVLAGLGV